MSAELLAKPLLGWLGDRYPKLRIIRYGNWLMLCTTLVTLWLSMVGTFHAAMLTVIMILSGIVIGLRDPLQSSIIPELSPPADIEHAFRSKTTLWSIALVLGPAFSGLLLSFGAIYIPFMVNTCLVLGAIALTPVGHGHMNKQTHALTQSACEKPTPLQLIISGFAMVVRVKMERYLGLFSMAVNFVLAPFFVTVVPFYVKEVISQPAWYAGLLDASFGIGIVLGSCRILGVLKHDVPRDYVLQAGFCLLGMNLLALGLGIHAFGLPLFFVLGGMGLIWINLNTAIIRSTATPIEFRNRMIATVAFMSQAASPFGNLVIGEAISRWDTYTVTTVAGGFILLFSVLLIFVPHLRLFMRMNETDLSDAYAKFYPLAFNH